MHRNPDTDLDKGNEPIYHIALLHLGSNATQRFHGLLPDDRLLHSAKRFQGRQQHMGVLHSSNVGDKAAQLIRHSQKHFIVIIIVLAEEGYKLFTRPLLTERPCDGGKTADGVQPQLNIIILQLVDKNCNGIQGLLYHRHISSHPNPPSPSSLPPCLPPPPPPLLNPRLSFSFLVRSLFQLKLCAKSGVNKMELSCLSPLSLFLSLQKPFCVLSLSLSLFLSRAHLDLFSRLPKTAPFAAIKRDRFRCARRQSTVATWQK